MTFCLDSTLVKPEINMDIKNAIILLHGYGENAYHMVKRLSPIIPESVTVLAPNGPFPLPTKTQTTVKLGYAWYFYDSRIDKYYIDFSVATSILENLLTELKLADKKLRIIGFSQGGYLSPFAGLHLKNTFHAIGINSSTRVDFIQDQLSFRFDQVNGEEDEFVDPILAKKRFEKLKEKGLQGEFVLLPNETHFLSRGFLPAIEKLIKQIC